MAQKPQRRATPPQAGDEGDGQNLPFHGGRAPWAPLTEDEFLRTPRNPLPGTRDLRLREGEPHVPNTRFAAKKGGKVELYDKPKPKGMKSKTMTPAQKAKAAKIAKASGDKKVGLYARINAMKKTKK